MVRSSVITLRFDCAIMGAKAATISTKPARFTLDCIGVLPLKTFNPIK